MACIIARQKLVWLLVVKGQRGGNFGVHRAGRGFELHWFGGGKLVHLLLEKKNSESVNEYIVVQDTDICSELLGELHVRGRYEDKEQSRQSATV